MKESTDIWFCSYLKMKGHHIKDYTVISSNKGRFFFDMTEAEWKKMKLEFDSSEIGRMKLEQIALKDLLH